ncbi:hypothetical protein F2Q68_00041539 [Brassica cretica]|uniref:FBD domain-containing protein n=1 Tax=Brassica cretica TaxID=69181 RepID=A0A8S9MPG9_BRACR|nr:hypothetical protein F2Q68_00041539 [Brassica cretica]
MMLVREGEISGLEECEEEAEEENGGGEFGGRKESIGVEVVGNPVNTVLKQILSQSSGQHPVCLLSSDSIFLGEHSSSNYPGFLRPRVMDEWNQPNTVPECLFSGLQRLSWSEYTGEPQERDTVVYILKHALHLKTVPKFE